MPVETMSCLIQELFAGIATLLRGMPHSSYAIVYRTGNRVSGARSLLSGFGNVISDSFHYGIRHETLPSPLQGGIDPRCIRRWPVRQVCAILELCGFSVLVRSAN
jgi:hypothetical protein